MKEINKRIREQEKQGNIKVYNYTDYVFHVRQTMRWYDIELWGKHMFINTEKRETPKPEYTTQDGENRWSGKNRALNKITTKIKRDITKPYYSAHFYTLMK